MLTLPNVKPISFCPEDYAFGTPRATPDIHDGTGWDVLRRDARVLSDAGEDWTAPMLRAADAMLRIAQRREVHLAVLMHISAACGSQVIYRGARSHGVHQAGQGVCAALLIENGIKVVSQRDYRTLARLIYRLDPSFVVPERARDHHESDWYLKAFGPFLRSAPDQTSQ